MVNSVLPITLSETLGTDEHLPRSLAGAGRRFYVKSLSGGTDVWVKVGSRSAFKISKGDKYTHPDNDYFGDLVIQNRSSTETPTVEMIVTDGDIDILNETFSGTFNSGDTLETPAIVTTTGATEIEIVASAIDRNEVHIQNLSASENLWIGASGVGNDASPKGIKIVPGGIYILSTGGQVYGRRGGAVNIDIGILELKD